jgi:hypothetical protein
MEKDIALALSKELKISIDRLVREYWEMVILREISQGKIGDYLIFVGGTALRLCYNSPRFSDDLDFYLRKKLSFSLFKREIQEIAEKHSLLVTDLCEKYFTYLAEFRIEIDYLTLPFRIKIEIRKRILKRGYEPKLLVSPTVNFQVLIYTLNLEEIKKLKAKALEERKDSRDFFDLWFISQKQKIIFQKPDIEIDKKFFKQNLLKYLPYDYKKIIENLTR